MEAISLEPSDTGMPGGKRTGQHMSHDIRDRDRSTKPAAPYSLRAGRSQGWTAPTKAPRTSTKKGQYPHTQYICPACGVNAWAKPDIVLLCGSRAIALVVEEGDEEA
jgi:hypothetical protein